MLFDYPNRNEGEENFVLFFTSAKASVGEEEIYLFDYPNRNEGLRRDLSLRLPEHSEGWRRTNALRLPESQ